MIMIMTNDQYTGCSFHYVIRNYYGIRCSMRKPERKWLPALIGRKMASHIESELIQHSTRLRR